MAKLCSPPRFLPSGGGVAISICVRPSRLNSKRIGVALPGGWGLALFAVAKVQIAHICPIHATKFYIALRGSREATLQPLNCALYYGVVDGAVVERYIEPSTEAPP